MMQNKGKQKKPIEIVHKPIIPGSWHGRDAWRMALKRMLSVLATTLIYLFGSILLSFDNIWGRILMLLTIVGGVAYYQYMAGMSQGESDVAYGEIIYGRRENGSNVPAEECERSFHPSKGFFAVLMGAAPFVAFTAVFACLAQPITYSLGVLPAWTEGLMSQTEFAAAMGHYNVQTGMSVLEVMRVIDRAMIMPFVNVTTALGNDAVLLTERLSPLLVLVAPLGYAFGYTRGQHLRDRVNTGIKMGDDRKKKREAKARRKRQRQKPAAKGPQQLV